MRHLTISFRARLANKKRRGGAALELAAALPVLVLLTMGVAEFGRVYASTMRVTNAVKAAAQYAVQSVQTTGDTAVINQVARNDAGTAAIDSITTTRVCKCPDGTTPSCTGSCPSYGAPEVFVKIRARKTVAMLFKYPGLPEQFVIVDTATYRLQ